MLSQLLRQVQKIQGLVNELHSTLAEKRVEVVAGGGMVRVVVNGNQEVIELRIDPRWAQVGDLELLEELIVAAVNQAMARAQELATEEMKRVAGGLSLPHSMGGTEEGGQRS